MNTIFGLKRITPLLLLFATLNPQLSTALAQGTTFSYQGSLSENNQPATGLYEFRFILYNAEIGGNQAGPILTKAPVPVTNGLFATTLDFGAGVFDGQALWVELAVRPSGSVNPFDPLAPRQPILPTPYAITASNLIGTLPAAQLSGTIPSPQLGGVYGNAVTFNNAGNSFAGNGAGLTSLNANNLASGIVPDGRLSANVSLLGRTIESAEIADGTITATDLNAASFSTAFWRAGGNLGTDSSVHFLGTIDSQSLEFRVGNTRALRLEPVLGGANLIGGYSGNAVSPGRGGATIAGGGTPGQANQVQYDFGTVSGGKGNDAGGEADTIGGGDRNRIGPGGFDNTISGGLLNDIGSNTTASAVGGGWDNNIGLEASFSTIGGGQLNHINFRTTNAVIAGGRQNIIGGDSLASTIAGGRFNNIDSRASFGTISGGELNNISFESFHSTIAGGGNNEIGLRSGPSTIGGGFENSVGDNSGSSTVAGGQHNDIGASSLGSAIGGGVDNNIGDSAGSSTIAGGAFNDIGANASNSTIGGGRGNDIGAGADFATIPGGNVNVIGAGADYAFAAGYNANANHRGSFVWADSSNFDFSSTVANGFFVRSIGGVKFVTGINPSTGAETAGLRLVAGSSAWDNLSDRNSKENVEPVDTRALLERLVRIPIQTWNWKAQEDSIRHIGPMAQDFYTAFNVGEDDKHITTVDADGVALAAIQGLNQKVEEQRAENEKLRARLEKLEQLLLLTNGAR